jgi:hypothetical protein
MSIPNKRPLYIYALDEQESLIHVNQAESGHIYACPGCKARFVLHRGPKKTEHFKHYSEDPCGGETYLHNVAKRLFFTSYQRALREHQPFTLKLSREVYCANYKDIFIATCLSSEAVDFDLTRFFDHVQLEVEYGGFIPDVLLSSTTRKEVLFVEIAVTHPCEQKKIDSGFRIIEFSVCDEADLDLFNHNAITPGDFQIKAYNFNVAPREVMTCLANCTSEESFLGIDAGGIVRKLEGTRKIVGRALRDGDIVAHQMLKPNENSAEPLRRLLRQAVDKGVKCFNCYLCPHASLNADFPRAYCLKKSKQVRYSEADRCKYYKVEY